MESYLHLQDGRTFKGKASSTLQEPMQGEIVFFTGMTGYQEVLTDPSYKDQIVVFTYPLIGNYGINDADEESREIQVSGVVMYQCTQQPSHFQSTQSLGAYLEGQQVPYLTGVDTREVTKAIRAHGTQQAAMSHQNHHDFSKPSEQQIFAVQGEDVETYGEGDLHVGLIDFGWKKSILQSLLKRHVKVSVIPFTQVEEVHTVKPDALILSNGPGDPKDALPKIDQIKAVLDEYPSFGICMGHQVIALAYGADTEKLPFGHRGANHPVKDAVTGKVFLTSQNHNYVVKKESLSHTPLTERFSNVNDRSIEGLMHHSGQLMSAQFHPEAHPGPHDAEWLFDDFIGLVSSKGVKEHV
ncbi:carbamoyl phosphate synthase small subunit [Halobacillus halophilus]|uniref:carbamoyl phosphate synthase small subunit n=1 Tax=Halobacillus halophilus TaxID=1570 RepID=UPI00136FCB79|nr:carbamoyl phosphate synthase small subunit [Halobacillus halophilus]MYL29525.1 carbamoyl phosphate synthase small subunit [Halobacillus halophilus]